MIIIPAVVPKSLKDLENKVGAIVDLEPLVQIDVSDGKFTSDKNWPFVGDNGEFAKIKEGQAKLPFFDNVDYEIHLMTESPADEVADWAKVGVSRILVPIEAGSDAVMDILGEWGKTVEIGLVANMETPVQVFESYFDKVSTIQFMSIDVIGHQGEPFDEKVLDKIKRLREIGYKHQISVDGGVNLANAKRIIGQTGRWLGDLGCRFSP
jgi:pentose-5-phosphate-3-epimerase